MSCTKCVPILRWFAPKNWLHCLMLHWMWRAGLVLQMFVWQSGSDWYWILFCCFCTGNSKPLRCKILFCSFITFVCICDIALCTFSSWLNRKLSAKLYKIQENQELKCVLRYLMWSTHIFQVRSLRLWPWCFIYYRLPECYCVEVWQKSLHLLSISLPESLPWAWSLIRVIEYHRRKLSLNATSSPGL